MDHLHIFQNNERLQAVSDPKNVAPITLLLRKAADKLDNIPSHERLNISEKYHGYLNIRAVRRSLSSSTFDLNSDHASRKKHLVTSCEPTKNVLTINKQELHLIRSFENLQLCSSMNRYLKPLEKVQHLKLRDRLAEINGDVLRKQPKVHSRLQSAKIFAVRVNGKRNRK